MQPVSTEALLPPGYQENSLKGALLKYLESSSPHVSLLTSWVYTMTLSRHECRDIKIGACYNGPPILSVLFSGGFREDSGTNMQASKTALSTPYWSRCTYFASISNAIVQDAQCHVYLNGQDLQTWTVVGGISCALFSCRLDPRPILTDMAENMTWRRQAPCNPHSTYRILV